jgi:hypothetical protein
MIQGQRHPVVSLAMRELCTFPRVRVTLCEERKNGSHYAPMPPTQHKENVVVSVSVLASWRQLSVSRDTRSNGSLLLHLGDWHLFGRQRQRLSVDVPPPHAMVTPRSEPGTKPCLVHMSVRVPMQGGFVPVHATLKANESLWEAWSLLALDEPLPSAKGEPSLLLGHWACHTPNVSLRDVRLTRLAATPQAPPKHPHHSKPHEENHDRTRRSRAPLP